MNVDRLSITLDPKLGAEARKAARRAKISLSAWLALATANQIRNEALGRFLDEWENEEGAFTAAELHAAAAKLGFRRRKSSRR